MAMQIKWRDTKYQVTTRKIKAIESFSYAVKVNKDGSTGKVKGKEPQTISYKVKLGAAAGVNVRSELNKLAKRVGKVGKVIINKKRFGPAKMRLNDISSDVKVDSNGRFIEADVTLNYEQKKKAKKKSKKNAKASKSAKSSKKSNNTNKKKATKK